jgi:hypothetical protein
MWGARAVVVSLVSVAALAATPASGSAKGSAGANAGRPAVCRLKHGHTVLQRGTIRIFSIKTPSSGGPAPSVETVYGCLRGDRKAWKLWESTSPSNIRQTDNVEQVADTFIALHETRSVEANFGESLTVFDLRNGSKYSIASIYDQSIGPQTPWPIAAYVLGLSGRSLVLAHTFVMGIGPFFNTTGETLEMRGFHHYRRTLATAGPSAINPCSLTYTGHTVTWTENGTCHSASV